MELLKKLIHVILVFSLWSYTLTIVNEYMINRPMPSFIQLLVSIGILIYSVATLYCIYKILTKNKAK